MSSAFAGRLIPGVQATGLAKPRFVYKGDDIVNPDEIYGFLGVPARGQSFKLKIRRNGTAIQKASADAEIEITAGSEDASVTGLDNFTVSDGDIFEVDRTQVGNDGPGEGSDLVWEVTR